MGTISLLQAICGFGMLFPSKENCVKGLEAELLDSFADKISVGSVRRFGKCLRRLNKRKFELN